MRQKPYRLSVKVVIRDRGRGLLLRRSASSKHNAGQWDFAGGKVDRGEDFATALLPAVHVVMRVLTARKQSGRFRLSREHDAARWVRPGRFSALPLSGELARLLNSITNGASLRALRRPERRGN